MNGNREVIDVETVLKMIHDVARRKNSPNTCRMHGGRRFEIKPPSGQCFEISRRDLELMKFCWEQGWITLEHAACMFFPRFDYWSEEPYRQVHRLIKARLMKEEEEVDSHTYSVTRMGINLLKRLKIINDLSALKKLNNLPLEGDNFATETRIIFARELKIRNWISKRILIAQDSEYKEFDGLIQKGGTKYIIRAEVFIRSQKYYRKQFKQFKHRNSKRNGRMIKKEYLKDAANRQFPEAPLR